MLDDDDLMDGDDFMDDDDGFDDDFGDDDDDGEGEDGEDDMGENAMNLYYQAKEPMKNGEYENAEAMFRRALEVDQEKRSEYGFKALKRVLKMMLGELVPADSEKITTDFKQLLSYVDGSGIIGMNDAEGKILDLLDLTVEKKGVELLKELVKLAGDCFLKNKNGRGWFKANMKVVQTLIKNDQVVEASARLDELLAWCELAPGLNDPRKESSLLEVLAMKMLCTNDLTGKNGLRRLVLRSSSTESESATLNPRISATINECSGKVNLFEHRWSDAKEKLFKAFKNYDESGSPRRVLCLRLIVIAALMENSTISPFQSPETKSLVSHEDIVPVVLLWEASESLNVVDFNAAVKSSFEKDDFGRQFIPLLIRNFRKKKIAEIVKAYSKVRISFVAKQLQISDSECKDLITQLILDGQLAGSVDQINMILCVDEEGISDTDAKYNAMAQWSRHVALITESISTKVTKGGRDDSY